MISKVKLVLVIVFPMVYRLNWLMKACPRRAMIWWMAESVEVKMPIDTAVAFLEYLDHHKYKGSEQESQLLQTKCLSTS